MRLLRLKKPGPRLTQGFFARQEICRCNVFEESGQCL